jgi:hypothetical protein
MNNSYINPQEINNEYLNITSVPVQQRQSAQVTGLSPATTYVARVCSLGDLDSSPFSRPFIFTTLEEAPEAPPTSVSAEATLNPGELKITWLPPPVHTLNGLILGYTIKVVPQINDQSGKIFWMILKCFFTIVGYIFR